ncbi:hypothetical protein Tco_1010383 [Tanacetum coccineum]
MSNTNTNLQTQTSSVLQNDTASLCSTSKVQEKTQLSRLKCMNSLRAIHSQLKFLIETLQDFGNMPIFKRTFSQDLDLLEDHLTKETISQTDCKTTLTKLRTTFENAFSSEIKVRMQNYTQYDAQSFYDAMIFNMDSLGKYMLELILRQQRTPQFAHLKVLLKEDLKGTRIEHGFKRAFMSLFGQDVDTFTRTMLLNVDQLQKQLDKDEFQEDGSMTAFWVVNNQFQKFIDSKFTLDYDSQMTDTRFVQYQWDRGSNFRNSLLQNTWVDVKSLLLKEHVIKDSMKEGTDSTVQDDSNRSGNDTDADDADIRPIYDEEPMAEYPETCQVKSPKLDSSPDNQTTEYSKQSLESENILLKETVAQFQKDFSRMEAHCIALELKYQNQSLKSGQHGQILNETSNKAKIEKEIDVLETMNIKLEHSVAKIT